MKTITPEDAIQRFTHIDAESMSCQLGFEIQDCFLKFAFYPWWEHPKYLKAVQEKKKWAFQPAEDAAQEIIFRPIGLVEFKISKSPDIADMDFPISHPALWKYQNKGKIFVNSDFPTELVSDKLKAKLNDYFSWLNIYSLIDPKTKYSAPFSFNDIPQEIFQDVIDVLFENKVEHYVPHWPDKGPELKILVLDGRDYIIAKDFEIEVPDFIHKDEWYIGEI